jgi:hypothetical protein
MNQAQKIKYTTKYKQMSTDERQMHMTYMFEALEEQLNSFEREANLDNNMDLARLAQIEFLYDYLDKVSDRVGTGPNNV